MAGYAAWNVIDCVNLTESGNDIRFICLKGSGDYEEK